MIMHCSNASHINTIHYLQSQRVGHLLVRLCSLDLNRTNVGILVLLEDIFKGDLVDIKLDLPSLTTISVHGTLQKHTITRLFGNLDLHGTIGNDNVFGRNEIVQNSTLASCNLGSDAVHDNGTISANLFARDVSQDGTGDGTRSNFAVQNGTWFIDSGFSQSGVCLLVGNAHEFAQQLSIAVVLQELEIVLGVQLEESIIPPAGILTNIDSTKEPQLGQIELRLECRHTVMMHIRDLSFNALLRHETGVLGLRKREWHPKVWIRIEFGRLGGQFDGIFLTQTLQ
mmetsp:Transcript_29723/g.49053  ORF Transcript_29723/g.49053 Transcript_29723/m.49053 type:complete len:284 (+) Transcript_29723:72-923(+)